MSNEIYKPANIKSKRELCQRLMDGEVFYAQAGSEVTFDESAYGNPFRIDGHALSESFQYFGSFLTKVEWYENIPPRGVLCWVWTDNPRDQFVALVTDYDGDFFLDGEKEYKHAKPLTKEEAIALLAEEESC